MATTRWHSPLAPSAEDRIFKRPIFPPHGIPKTGFDASEWVFEGDQLVVAAVTAAQAQEAVGQDAAHEEGIEFVLHKLRQVGACGRLGLLHEEARGMLLDEAVQRGLFRAVAFAVNWGAILRPLRLPADGCPALRGQLRGLGACATDRFRAVSSRWAMSLQGRPRV